MAKQNFSRTETLSPDKRYTLGFLMGNLRMGIVSRRMLLRILAAV